MPTITTTAYNTPAYVLVQVDWTDVPEVTHAQVTRRNTVTGEVVTLRPYISFNEDGYLALNCGLGIWWDTEPPLNVELEYCTIAADVETVISTNCCFESATAPWAGTDVTLAQSATFAHEGTFSCRLTPSGGSFTSYMQNVDVVPFTTEPLTLSAWVLSPQGWNSVHIEVTLQYEDLILETIKSDYEIVDDSQWTYLSTAVQPRMAGNIVNITFQINGPVPATTLFYVDEIQVTQPQAVTTTACDTVTVSSESVWLKSPLHPCSDVEVDLCVPGFDDCESEGRVSYIGTSDEDRPANTAILDPDNRQYPIPESRQRKSARATLRLLAHNCDARDDILNINNPGDELLFQAPATYCIPDRYISVATLTEQRFSVDQRDDFRLMIHPYVVVERPVGPADGPCGIRMGDLCDIYASWGSMTIGGLTYEDLLLGFASHDSPTNPLPEDARVWLDVETEFATWLAVEAGGSRDWGELRDGL